MLEIEFMFKLQIISLYAFLVLNSNKKDGSFSLKFELFDISWSYLLVGDTFSESSENCFKLPVGFKDVSEFDNEILLLKIKSFK